MVQELGSRIVLLDVALAVVVLDVTSAVAYLVLWLGPVGMHLIVARRCGHIWSRHADVRAYMGTLPINKHLAPPPRDSIGP